MYIIWILLNKIIAIRVLSDKQIIRRKKPIESFFLIASMKNM